MAGKGGRAPGDGRGFRRAFNTGSSGGRSGERGVSDYKTGVPGWRAV
ncbi:hypothetical protein SBA6_1050013 [Candidatus Sulfopaludibacter sp. SbA6]|nr:hypothetical protein SBA6_1050013 [Candidatus Sulfopaludibacter sp. SbA6]